MVRIPETTSETLKEKTSNIWDDSCDDKNSREEFSTLKVASRIIYAAQRNRLGSVCSLVNIHKDIKANTEDAIDIINKKKSRKLATTI
ncbi:hypothetical protein AVEN_173569-1 [Araneus ventricosus]|uniref:Uncharacterized protein n=1 Tax=Araneus ventricosus TaxID=182803 RepID=A0A4Y2CQS3_ARAVE|nr:hypothetical protein AVEN_173569-1 [Araneus ventricosus]